MAVEPIVNPADIQQLIRKDKIFGEIKKQYQAPPDWSRPPGFVALSKLIIEQQVSLASANAHYLKLSQYINAFTPANILQLSDLEMRNCQISRQKMTYLRALSSAILEETLDLDQLQHLPETEIRKQLTSIKGIGEWTSDIYLMFCLRSKDIFPLGDVAIVNTMNELTRRKTRETMLRHAEKWRPLRSLATYFLWHYYLSRRNRGGAVPV